MTSCSLSPVVVEVPLLLSRSSTGMTSSSSDGSATSSRLLVCARMAVEQSATKGKRLSLQLTCPSDPFFYYSMLLNEDDFHTLKQTQGLLVDYSSFLPMIHQLVSQCASEAKAENPKFRLMLEDDGGGNGGGMGMGGGNTAVLSFQEINPFRHLCHLSLKISRGSDSQVKEYLATVLRTLRENSSEETQRLQARVHTLESRLSQTEQSLEESKKEVERLRAESGEQGAAFNARRVEDVAKEKEAANRAIGEMQERYDRERRETSDTHTRTVRQLENRLAALDYENKDLLERRLKNEASVQRLTDQSRAGVEENARLKRELEAARREAGMLNSGCQDREREKAQLLNKIALLEQEKFRLQGDSGTKSDLLQSVTEQKNRLEKDLRDKESLVVRREAAVKTVSQELLKANEVIKKFQDQVKSEHQKVKVSAKVIGEQEKVVQGKDQELESIRSELKQLSERLSTSDAEKKALEDSQSRAVERAEALEKKVSTNENVIHWLNKQLTAAQARDPGLKLQGVPPQALHGKSFTPSGMKAASTPLGLSNVNSVSAAVAGGPGVVRNRVLAGNSNASAAAGKKKLAAVPSSGYGTGNGTFQSRKNQTKENNPNGLDDRYLRPTSEPNSEASKPPSGGLLRQEPPSHYSEPPPSSAPPPKGRLITQELVSLDV